MILSVRRIGRDNGQKLALITNDLFRAMGRIRIKIERVPFFEVVDLVAIKIIHLPFEHIDELYPFMLKLRKLIISRSDCN